MADPTPSVDQLLAAMADAARRNEKGEFDRLERKLLDGFDGGFDGMPEEIYRRYLDVDRHWPIAVVPASDGPTRRTLQIRLGAEEEAWLQELAVESDRSLSAVVAECVDAVRADSGLTDEVRGRLEQGRRLPDD
jgi:hypothetical protein